MYGILFFVISGIFRFGANVILAFQDVFSRKKSIKNGNLIYIDHDGSSRMVTTGKRFSAGENTNGHWVWTDDNMNVIKDITQESIDNKRQKNYNFAKQHGHIAYLWMSPKWGQTTSEGYGKTYKEYFQYFKNPNELNKKHLPRLYKDVDTGEIYVVKELWHKWYDLINELIGTNITYKHNLNRRYFVNPKTNCVVKPIDNVCLFNKNSINLTQKEMDIINALTLEKNKNFFHQYDKYENDIYWKERK